MSTLTVTTENYNLYLGDCLEVMSLISQNSIDLILADLPYSKTELNWDKMLPMDRLWEKYKNIRKYKAPIVLTASEPFTSFMIMSNLEWFRYKWTWEKDKAANFFQAHCMPLATCEDVIVFNQTGYATSVKDKPIYNPQMTDSKIYQEPNKSKSTNQFSLRQIIQRKNPVPLESSQDYDGWKRYPKSKIYFPVDYGKKRLHPTQKPVALMEYLILTYTNEGDIVLDNTMGSGSTGEACLRTGRKFIGIEKDPEYFEIARKRLETVGLMGSKYKKTEEETSVEMSLW